MSFKVKIDMDVILEEMLARGANANNVDSLEFNEFRLINNLLLGLEVAKEPELTLIMLVRLIAKAQHEGAITEEEINAAQYAVRH